MRKSACMFAFLLAVSASAAASDRAVRLELLPLDDSLASVPSGLAGKVTLAGLRISSVRFAVVPGQDEAGRLWSSWGDALFASDGRFYFSLGDHGAPFGRSYVWALDPSTGQLELAVDYNAVVGLKPPGYAPGKIHAPIVEGADRALYIIGYRGSIRRTGPETGFQGDWLLRYDLATRRAEVLGIPAPGYSTPVLAFCRSRGLLYGLGVPGLALESEPPHALFYRYDPRERAVRKPFRIGTSGPRAMILAEDGRAWFGRADGALLRFDPQGGEDGEIVVTGVKLPGDGRLRAASKPNSEGVVFGMTADGTVFAFDTRREQLRVIGEAFPEEPRYTAVCKLGPSGTYLYYLPGAHGRTRAIGTPLVRMDTGSGQVEVVAFLHDYLRRHANYHAGGSYGFAIDKSGRYLCILLNGSSPPASRQPDFGTVAVVLLELEEGQF